MVAETGDVIEQPAPPKAAFALSAWSAGYGGVLKVLEQRSFPAQRVVALASARSAGKKLPFAGGELTVEEMTPASFEGVDIALVIDRSGSMRFDDLERRRTRLDVVKDVVADFAARRMGDSEAAADACALSTSLGSAETRRMA